MPNTLKPNTGPPSKEPDLPASEEPPKLPKKESHKVDIEEPYGWNLPTLSAEQAEWLDEWFGKRGLSVSMSAPRICHQGCSMRPRCPLEALQVPLPIGCQCPIEHTQIRRWANDMRESLGIPADDKWSLMLLEYAGMWMILLQRAQTEPNSEDIVIDSYRGVDKEGNALYEKKVNPAHAFSERVHKIIQSVGRELVATREARAKLSQDKPRESPDEFARKIEALIIDANKADEEKIKRIAARADNSTTPGVDDNRDRDLPKIKPNK